MSLEGWTKFVRGDYATGTEFAGGYVFGKNGLVRINISPLFRDKKPTFEIKRHDIAKVVISTFMDKNFVDPYYKREECFGGVKYLNSRLPWSDDTIKGISALKDITEERGIMTIVKSDKCVRSGNRIDLNLLEALHYIIQVPNDTLVESHLGILKPDANTNEVKLIKYDDQKTISIPNFGSKGLIRVTQMPEIKDINLTISRCSNDSLKISSSANIKTAIKIDNTDTDITKFYGGDRADIKLCEPGNYELNIPFCADLETDLQNVNIAYITGPTIPTSLYVDCKKVNFCGDSGYCDGKREHWSYYIFGSYLTDAKTILKTDESVLLPESAKRH